MKSKLSYSEQILAKAASNKTEVRLTFASGHKIITPVIRFDKHCIVGIDCTTDKQTVFERRNINAVSHQ